MRKTKYTDFLKKEVAEMFESGMSAKQIAVAKTIPVWLAFYLEYEGRRILGLLPEKRPYRSRKSKEARDFVENNVYEHEVNAIPFYAVLGIVILLAIGVYVFSGR